MSGREEREEGRGEEGRVRRGERREAGERRFFPIHPIYLHMLSYTVIYVYIPPYGSKYSQILQIILIPPYAPIYSRIFNIRKMRANIKHENGHQSSPRASRGSKSNT